MMGKNPFEKGKKFSKEEMAQALRLAIISELDAINLYTQFASACTDKKIKEQFEDVAREEKTHVGEFLELLLKLDPQQVKELEEGRKEVNKENKK